MRAYLASFRGQPGKRIAGRIGIVAASLIGASAVLYGVTTITLVLCAILLGFALIIPEVIVAAAGIVALFLQPKTDFTVGIVPPLFAFLIYWIWFAAHFFHF